MNETVKEIVERFYRSAAQKDDKWQEYLADNVSFSVAAKEKFVGKEMFIKAYTAFLQSVEKLEVRQLFIDNDTACAIINYDYISSNSVTFRQDDAEVWKVADGKIVSFTLYYDETEYRALMAQ